MILFRVVRRCVLFVLIGVVVAVFGGGAVARTQGAAVLRYLGLPGRPVLVSDGLR